MAIRVQRFPEYRVNLHIFSGAITVKDLLNHVKDLDVAVRWLCYFGPTTDLSGIDLAHMPEVRRAVRLREQERAGTYLPTAIVAASNACEPVLQFWRDYASAGLQSPHEPVVFDSLEAACRWFGLPDTAQDKLAAEISAPEASRRASRGPEDQAHAR